MFTIPERILPDRVRQVIYARNVPSTACVRCPNGLFPTKVRQVPEIERILLCLATRRCCLATRHCSHSATRHCSLATRHCSRRLPPGIVLVLPPGTGSVVANRCPPTSSSTTCRGRLLTTATSRPTTTATTASCFASLALQTACAFGAVGPFASLVT